MFAMQEIITRTRRVYSGRIIRLDVHDVRLPDGSESIREVVQHRGAVAVVPLLDNRDVVLIRQFRIGANAILHEIPAGLLEVGEPPETCATRELQEEIGYRPVELESLGGFYVAPGYTTEYIHLYLATQLVESHLWGDDDEFLEIVRIPFADALRMIETGDIVDGKTITGLLRTARRLNL